MSLLVEADPLINNVIKSKYVFFSAARGSAVTPTRSSARLKHGAAASIGPS